MKTKPDFYMRPNGRYYYIHTFLYKNYKRDEWEERDCPVDLSPIRNDFQLFWNKVINRYVLFRFSQLVQAWVKILVIEGPNKTYREPGEWIYWHLRKTDFMRFGSLREGQKVAEREVWALSPIEQKQTKDYLEMLYNLNKEYDTYMVAGRTSAMIGQGNASARKFNKKKQYFVNTKTGQKTNRLQDIPDSVLIGLGLKEFK